MIWLALIVLSLVLLLALVWERKTRDCPRCSHYDTAAFKAMRKAYAPTMLSGDKGGKDE